MERGTGRFRASTFFLLPSTVAHPFPGFTLIELIFVMAILGILLVAVVPQFQGARARLRTEQAVVELAQLLRLAHERAVAEGRTTVWTWDETARRALVKPSDAQNPPAGSVTQSRRIPEDLSLVVTRAGASVECQCVAFFADGTSGEGDGLPMRVEFGASGADYAIQVDAATSRVSVEPRGAES